MKYALGFCSLMPREWQSLILSVGTVGALLAGGCGQQVLPDTEPIPGGGRWRSFKSPPVPLHEHAAAVMDGRVYLVGGRLPDGPVATLYRYDPQQDNWTQLASHPGNAVDHMQAAVVNGILYAIGGTEEWPQPSVSAVYAYDPAKNEWSQKSPLPVPLGSMGVGVVNGRIYAIGGLSGGQATNFVFEYDPAGDSWDDWTDTCPMPTPRDHFVAATVNGRIHCIGGRQVTISSILNVHEVFDPLTQQWETRAPLPTARGGFAAAVLNGRILIMGGEGAANSLGVFSDNEEYDPSTDTWRRLSPMTAPRHSTQAGVANGIVFVAGGAPSLGRTFTSVHEAFSFSFEE